VSVPVVVDYSKENRQVKLLKQIALVYTDVEIIQSK